MSAAPIPKQHMTPSDYLGLERASSTRHEFFAGEMYAMAGTSRAHSLLGINIITKLNAALDSSDCEVHGSELRVHVPATGLYTYPAVSVACPPQFLDPKQLDTLVNPLVLVEVLSDSTEAYDRGKKFENYREIPSLRTYVLVAQDRVHVERYTRQQDGGWVLHVSGQGERFEIGFPCGAIELAVDEIYKKVF